MDDDLRAIISDDDEANQNYGVQTAEDLESELSEFRSKWKKELEKQQNQPEAKQVQSTRETSTKESEENQAEYLFNKAVLLETTGRPYEAIKFYRLALQLDPEIEFKVASKRPAKQKVEHSDESDSESSVAKQHADEELSIFEQFQAMTIGENHICEKNFSQRQTHFSDLPMEVVMCLLKWIVSDKLDVRSLEAFSTVCKGFYVCARDQGLWRAICEKYWPNDCNSCSNYGSWREMYLRRPRLNFDGVYISKTTYIRAGEQSLDSFYRPWHLVDYFRYIRFYGDGSCIMLTTPDEPKIVVPKFSISKNEQRESSIVKGYWNIQSNIVSIFLSKKVVKFGINRSKRHKEMIVNQEQLFNIAFQIETVKRKLNFQLNWLNYEMKIINNLTHTESNNVFELTKSDFPSLMFSRVKSYTSASESPLS